MDDLDGVDSQHLYMVFTIAALRPTQGKRFNPPHSYLSRKGREPFLFRLI